MTELSPVPLPNGKEEILLSKFLYGIQRFAFSVVNVLWFVLMPLSEEKYTILKRLVNFLQPLSELLLVGKNFQIMPLPSKSPQKIAPVVVLVFSLARLKIKKIPI